MPYLIATDLDGTLLRPDFTVSDRTREALQSAGAAGIEVMYATGRPPRWLPEVYEATGYRPVTVCANGAVTLAGDDPIHIDGIDPETVDEVHAVLRDLHTDFVFHTEQWHGHTLKILAALPDLDHRDVDGVLAEVHGVVGHLVEPTHSASGRLLIEMGPGGVTKANAVDRLRAERWPGRTYIAIGDMPNDLALLESADIALTVESGHAWLRQIADHVLPGPGQDGVAQLLEVLIAGGSVSQFTGA
ncbi:MAG: HAD-IIB family hydrolase [Candidatus Nanopelagicales bacterium]